MAGERGGNRPEEIIDAEFVEEGQETERKNERQEQSPIAHAARRLLRFEIDLVTRYPKEMAEKIAPVVRRVGKGLLLLTALEAASAEYIHIRAEQGDVHAQRVQEDIVLNAEALEEGFQKEMDATAVPGKKLMARGGMGVARFTKHMVQEGILPAIWDELPERMIRKGKPR